MTSSLLEYLKQKIGCYYLSDLPSSGYRQQILEELSLLSEDAFPVREWNDTVNYITKEDLEFSTPKEALNYLANH